MVMALAMWRVIGGPLVMASWYSVWHSLSVKPLSILQPGERGGATALELTEGWEVGIMIPGVTVGRVVLALVTISELLHSTFFVCSCRNLIATSGDRISKTFSQKGTNHSFPFGSLSSGSDVIGIHLILFATSGITPTLSLLTFL